MVTLRYFAWLREKTGAAEERIALPEGVTTVAELIGWLAQQSPGHADAFANPALVRTALDQRHVKPDTLLAGALEIAFFPPVTGG
jgi:sulfur-carrier protein